MTPKELARLIAANPRIAALETDARGLPIPYVVLRDDDGTPKFAVNDGALIEQCAAEHLCTVCGDYMGPDDRWLLGGHLSALHPAGAFADPPVHCECAAFALQVCPYLAVDAHKGMKPKTREAVKDFVRSKGQVPIDKTMPEYSAKPESFFMVRVNGLVTIRSDDGGANYAASRPFEQATEWCDGEVLRNYKTKSSMLEFQSRGEALMLAQGQDPERLTGVMLALWHGALRGAYITVNGRGML